ncbi:MAG: polysaccharide export protein, partial [Bacteroidaceae bacterium]|nr:polysaccharide export protein [Bacteroidaceae bacterium]
MNIRSAIRSSLWVLVAFLVTSCVSNKKMVYMQGAAEEYAMPKDISDAFELRIQPDDQLAITVASAYADLLLPFNNKVVVGTPLNNSYSQQNGISNFQ